jgi:hypothetical protein
MKKFEDSSLKAQKNRIIKDAIKQIEMGMVIPASKYMSFSGLNVYMVEKSLQKTLEKHKCEACAKGSLFASCVINVNKVSTFDPFNSEHFQSEKLGKWFTQLELDMIETAFELDVITDSLRYLSTPGGNKSILAKECTSFGRNSCKGIKKDRQKVRLIAILNNVLEHGQFNPSEKALKIMKTKEEWKPFKYGKQKH